MDAAVDEPEEGSMSPSGRSHSMVLLSVSIAALGGFWLGGCAHLEPAFPKGLTGENLLQLRSRSGRIADPAEEAFSERRAMHGYWKPGKFHINGGANVYFLEPYNPDRIPILFIHGAAGSPRDWRYFFDNLDRDRYQAWFFYYPSGSSMDSTSKLLLTQLEELRKRYGLQELYITAHSMGGLLARSLLVRHGRHLSYVKLFISISTPWGGDGFAEFGTRHSPVVIPSWKDLRPFGPFLKALFDDRLPPSLDYYLFFGYRKGRGLLRPNSDGTVTLRSQLAPQAQAEATGVFGFDEDHVGILSSQEVLARYKAVLDAADRRIAGPSSISQTVPSSSSPTIH